MNHISQNIKRAMYLLGAGSKTFWCYTSSEAFYYFHSKISSAIIAAAKRKQSNVIY